MPGGSKRYADEQIIVQLASGKSIEAVAKLCGVSAVTIHRRLKNPGFRGRVRQARALVLERALGHLSRGSAEAAITLRNLLRSTNEKIKLGAASQLLGLGAKLREVEELEGRLAELEEQVGRLQRAQKEGGRRGVAWPSS
jgi:hypothetical protein